MDLRVDRLAEERHREAERHDDPGHDAAESEPLDEVLVRAAGVDVEVGLDAVPEVGPRGGRPGHEIAVGVRADIPVVRERPRILHRERDERVARDCQRPPGRARVAYPDPEDVAVHVEVLEELDGARPRHGPKTRQRFRPGERVRLLRHDGPAGGARRGSGPGGPGCGSTREAHRGHREDEARREERSTAEVPRPMARGVPTRVTDPRPRTDHEFGKSGSRLTATCTCVTPRAHPVRHKRCGPCTPGAPLPRRRWALNPLPTISSGISGSSGMSRFVAMRSGPPRRRTRRAGCLRKTSASSQDGYGRRPPFRRRGGIPPTR